MSRYIDIAKRLEMNTFYFINQRLKCRPLDIIMPRITYIGSAFFTIGLTLLIILVGKNQLRIAGWRAMAALIFSHGLVQILKLSMRRLRPFFKLKDVNILGRLPVDASFPSGHSTASFAVATSLALCWPSATAISIPLATLVALSRIYLGYHYPSDIMAGTLLGIISAIGIGWIW